MSTVSLLTIVKGRRRHLHNLLRGVAALDTPPAEVVIVHMNEAAATDVPDPGCRLVTAALYDPDHALPLARARNRAAELAGSERLLFLDVDCIPAPDYLDVLVAALDRTGGLLMGDVRYLPAPLPADWTMADLAGRALAHPRRPTLAPGEVRSTGSYHLFWSLTFAVTKTDFGRIGGFDERFTGYGGEDTDFAFSARAAGVPFALVGARCYHQHHATCTPPYNHLTDIVANAKAFHRKWDSFCMEGWLRAFAVSGHIALADDEVTVLRLPTQAEVDRHRSDDPFA